MPIMPPYLPPTIIETEVRANVIRPDDRNRIEYEASFLTDEFVLELGLIDFANPDVVAYRAIADLGDIEAGASVVEGAVIPEIAGSFILFDNANLYFQRGLYDSDPRAVEALIQQNIIGVDLDIGESDLKLQVAFNSDAVEVYEGWLSVPLTNSGLLTLKNYTRIASEDSDFYWSPEIFSNFGVLLALPLSEEVAIAAQPGIAIKEDGLRLTGGIGGQVQLGEWGRVRIGYAYGLTIEAQARITF